MLTSSSPWKDYIDLSVKLTGLIASISIVASLIYDWGFLFALNLTFLDIPSNIADHVRSALIWFPKVFIGLAAFFLLEMFLRRMERGLTEEEIIKNSSNPERTRLIRESPFNFIIIIAIFMLIAYVLVGDIFLDGLALSLMVLWGTFAGWANNHPRIIERRSRHLMLSTLVMPPIAIFLFFSGHSDAINMFKNQSSSVEITLINVAEPLPATILRQMDKGLLIKELSNAITFYPWSEVKKVKTSGVYTPSKGALCHWFGWRCQLPISVEMKKEAGN